MWLSGLLCINGSRYASLHQATASAKLDWSISHKALTCTQLLHVLSAVYFVQGILGLARLAVTYLFKDEFKLDPATVGLKDWFQQLSLALPRQPCASGATACCSYLCPAGSSMPDSNCSSLWACSGSLAAARSLLEGQVQNVGWVLHAACSWPCSSSQAAALFGAKHLSRQARESQKVPHAKPLLREPSSSTCCQSLAGAQAIQPGWAAVPQTLIHLYKMQHAVLRWLSHMTTCGLGR